MPEQNTLPENSNNVSAPGASPVVPAAPTPPVIPAAPVTPVTPQKSENSFYKRIDLFLAGMIGLVCALLILPIAENLGVRILYAYALIVLLPLLSMLGMWVASWLGQKIKFIYQVAKFILVGLLNSFIDWGILNLLMGLAGIFEGPLFLVFKGTSFLVATSNSYVWNKFWTFKKPVDGKEVAGKKATGKELLQFFIVSVISFSLNLGIAAFVVNILGRPDGISKELWANIGALSGTLAGLTWNFLGYKLIVFGK